MVQRRPDWLGFTRLAREWALWLRFAREWLKVSRLEVDLSQFVLGKDFVALVLQKI